MNTPGVSLFQGAESMKVNTTLERQEEAEMLEDQKRRNMELGAILQNAFDDLEDDESIVDSTSNYQSDLLPSETDHPIYQQQQQQQPPQHHPLQNFNEQYNHHHQHQHQHHQTPMQNGDLHAVCDSEIHKLKMLLESRTHELTHIKKITTEEKQKSDELQKRLSFAESELDRALAEKKNTHELLVDSKEKCSNLDNAILKVRNEKQLLESENSALAGKLETSQHLLAEMRNKYDMVERDFIKRDDRNGEIRIKQIEERHRGQMDLMEQQLSNLSDQLAKKKQELDTMSARYNALQATHESMLVDKATKINDLNLALNEAQSKCSELLSKPNYEGECQRLQNLIHSYQAQIASMEKTIATLNERLSTTTAELDLMDSVLHQHNLEDTPRRLGQVTQGKVIGSTPLNTLDRIGQIKDELCRALANLKGKREELRKLQINLEDRNNEIRHLRDEENKSLVQISTLREEKVRLETRVKILEQEIVATEAKNKKSINNSTVLTTVKQELDDLRQERDTLKKQCEELNQVKAAQENEHKNIIVQLKNVEVDLEELKQEHDSMKRNYEQIMNDNRQLRARATADNVRLDLERHKILLNDAQSECDRLKKLYTSIRHDKEMLAFELEKLRSADNEKELCEQRNKVAHLQRTLELQEMKVSELSKIMETEKLSHERELKTLREKLDKLKLEQAKAAKENTECTKCIDKIAENTQFEIQILKLNTFNSTLKKEIEELNMELKESKELVADLEEKLILAEKQEKLIADLKVKATQFEDYIKAHSSSSEANSNMSPKSQQVTTSDKSTTTPVSSKTSPQDQADIKKIEARIRNEMAQIFATELKRFQVKLQQTDEKSICLQREYKHVCNELQQRQNEVELLKEAILAEREKIEDMLAQKDIECRELMQKQKLILHKCRDELQAKNERISELIKELQERQSQIENERKSMKAVMAQWEEQRKSLDIVEQDWRDKMKELRAKHEENIDAEHAKYQSAKRMASNYKRYAEDKEAHMLREYDRLKLQYEESLKEMEKRINEILERKSHETKTTFATNKQRTITTIVPQQQQQHQQHQQQSQNKENKQPSNK